jgi:hypothetical protein
LGGEAGREVRDSDFDFNYDTPVVAPINLGSEDFDFLSGTFQPQPPKTKV